MAAVTRFDAKREFGLMQPEYGKYDLLGGLHFFGHQSQQRRVRS